MTYRIGGMFTLEKQALGETHFLQDIGTDTRHYMSGRCALYACLKEIRATDSKHTAYVPAYTCETVLSSYEKAGYDLKFYDVDKDRLTPMFRQEDLKDISVLLLCGYFGFSSYDRNFVRYAKKQGITVLQDTTHSIFSLDGHSPDADYYAGSVRKWMGIASGGVAIKREGTFSLPMIQPEETHLKGRYLAMQYRQEALDSGDTTHDKQASDVFWETEMRLRQMFDAFQGDAESEAIIAHFNPKALFERRRNNYQTVLDNLLESEQCKAVFPSLDDATCPSHFCFYSNNRDHAQKQLEKMGIRSTVYWPRPPMLKNPKQMPHAAWVYDHIASVQVDQRYDRKTMEYLGKSLSSLG
ncbi:MAG: hypothetical protein EOM68_00265 [Spirochaetia bacterium]|nr:hypothetical protein [Spirochaetia bacterium]